MTKLFFSWGYAVLEVPYNKTIYTEFSWGYATRPKPLAGGTAYPRRTPSNTPLAVPLWVRGKTWLCPVPTVPQSDIILCIGIERVDQLMYRVVCVTEVHVCLKKASRTPFSARPGLNARVRSNVDIFLSKPRFFWARRWFRILPSMVLTNSVESWKGGLVRGGRRIPCYYPHI